MDTNSEADRVTMEALDITLDCLNPNGKQLILGLLQKHIGLPSFQKDLNAPKEEIDLALVNILGPSLSRIIIEEWNKKIIKAKIT